MLSPKRFLSLLQRTVRRPPDVLAVKAAQFADLAWLQFTKGWERLEKKAERRWNEQRLKEWLRVRRGALIDVVGIQATRVWLQANPEEANKLAQLDHRTRSGNVRIFAEELDTKQWSDIPWTTDWRYEHTWAPAFFRAYNFYESKPQPYDVKFPWELSRFNFSLVPALQSCLNETADWQQQLLKIVQSWNKTNPVGNSVNWYPMECAMRLVNLVQLTDLVCAHAEPCPQLLVSLLKTCELHAEFVWRTIEFTEVRGNHFAAEIVALLLAGRLLGGTRGHRWYEYGRRHLDRELQSQFSTDGVQFEKSIPYHRLVTQLFLLGTLAVERAGDKLSSVAEDRLEAACRYSQHYTRPDGLSPTWGDNDDARATWFDDRDLTDHRGLVELAAARFDWDAATGTPAIEVPLFLGELASPPAADTACNTHFLRDGGMVIHRDRGLHLVADIGEVGTAGRGGHGHLDMFSFELSVAGTPIIVDPGSYIYTGDREQRNDFRGTASHNVATIAGEELASFPRDHLWRLGTEADPVDVSCSADNNCLEVRGHHHGFRRCLPNADFTRTLTLTSDSAQLSGPPTLVLEDSFKGTGTFAVERYLHFAPNLELEHLPSELRITQAGSSAPLLVIQWNEISRSELVDTFVSRNYGHKVPTKKLVLHDIVDTEALLTTQITLPTARTSSAAA